MKLEEVHVGGDVAPWRQCGFAATGNVIDVGVKVKVGGAGGITKMVFEGDKEVSTSIDGVACEVRRPSYMSPPTTHPNGVTGIDHVVMFTLDMEKVVGEFQTKLGLSPTRGPIPRFGRIMSFYRVGPTFIEVCSPIPNPKTPFERAMHQLIKKQCPLGTPTFMWGATFSTSNIEEAHKGFQPHAGKLKASAQSKDRRIFTARTEELGIPTAVAVIEVKKAKL